MNEQVIKILSNKWVIPAAVGVTSFGGGLVAGYIWGKRNGDVFVVDLDDIEIEGDYLDDPNQMVIDFEQASEFENETLREFTYGGGNVIPSHVTRQADWSVSYLEDTEEEVPVPWDPEEEAEALLEEDELEEAVAEQMHQDLITNDGDSLPEIQNVFNNDDQWSYEDELSVRTPDEPYVISVDEFVADEAGCEQSTVTYYAGDDIMANEFDVPIYDYNGMMGPLKFGHGSNDKTTVYIRNEKLGLEWEVLLHQGRFDVEVLGHDIEDAYAKQELKHSVPRFRDE